MLKIRNIFSITVVQLQTNISIYRCIKPEERKKNEHKYYVIACEEKKIHGHAQVDIYIYIEKKMYSVCYYYYYYEELKMNKEKNVHVEYWCAANV